MNKNKLFYGWWIVTGSVIMLAVMAPASVAVANLYQTPVVQEFGIENSQFALVNVIVLGMGVILSPYVSKLYSKGNFKGTYTFSVLLYAVSYFLYGFAPNIYVFYLLSVFVGFGLLATTILPVSILITNWFVEKRGLALSIAFSGLGLGGVIFSQLLTYLIETFGWRATYMIYGVIMLVTCLPVVLFIFRKSPEEMGLEPLGSLKRRPEDGEGEAEQKQSAAVPVSQTFKKPFFIMLIAGAVLVGIANNGGLGQFPPVLMQMHGASRMAIVVSVYSGVGIIGKLTLGVIADRFGILLSTIYASVMLAAAYLFMLFANNYGIAVVMGIFFGLGTAIGTVLPPLLTSSIYSTETYAKAYGYVQSGLNLRMTLGSIFAASIADYTGSYSNSWIALFIISIAMCALWTGSYLNGQKYLSSQPQNTAV